jgi:hypothetical protein
VTREFGQGPLSRAAALGYTLLVVGLLLGLTGAPGLVALVLLGRDPSNLPLVAVCALPLGPAGSAALYALHHRRRDATDLRPLAAFGRGYALNLGGVLRLWVPWLAWLTVIAVTLANLGAAAVPGWWAGLLGAVALGLALWGANATVIVSLFEFRTRDVARLAAYFLVRAPLVAVANAGLLLVAAAVVVLWSEAALALLASLFVFALLANSAPMIAAIREEFTR